METFISQVTPVLVSLVVALAGWGVAELTRWIRTRTKNERLNGAIDVIAAATMASVKEAELTIRPTLSDGKLTPAEIKGIKATVAANVKRRVGPAALKIAKENLTDLDDWIGAQAEASVYDLKNGEEVIK